MSLELTPMVDIGVDTAATAEGLLCCNEAAAARGTPTEDLREKSEDEARRKAEANSLTVLQMCSGRRLGGWREIEVWGRGRDGLVGLAIFRLSSEGRRRRREGGGLAGGGRTRFHTPLQLLPSSAKSQTTVDRLPGRDLHYYYFFYFRFFSRRRLLRQVG